MNKQIITNKHLINYHQPTSKGGKTLLFLHGWRCDSSIWKGVADLFKDDNFSIYLLDLPGFGGSDVPRSAFSLEDYADTVAGFIRKLELKNVTLVGHSVGGRIAIKLVAMKPELIDKLVLVDSAGFIQKRVGHESLAKVVKPFFKPSFMQGPRKWVYKKIGAEDYMVRPELKETFLNIINEDLSDQLPLIKKPTLIVWGEEDRDTPIEFAKKMNKEIKGSKLVAFPGAGHYSFLDKPSDFCKELLKFINQVL